MLVKTSNATTTQTDEILQNIFLVAAKVSRNLGVCDERSHMNVVISRSEPDICVRHRNFWNIRYE
jgi:hypothetical protein